MIRCPQCFAPLDVSRGGRCPHSHPLPNGWQHPTTCIVMAGARTTGKSIFIAVMMHQLEQFARPRGMEVRPLDPQTRRTFEESYMRPLYEERGLLEATRRVDIATQRDPLVFLLTLRDGTRHHLVIRDVAGEDLEKTDELTPGQLDFFAHADYVFFLFDPMQRSDIRARLRDFIPEHAVGGDPKAVLDNTLHLVAEGRPRLAVILSKFDVMQALRAVEGSSEWTRIMQNPGAAFYRDPGPYHGVNDADAELLHEEVRALLLKLDAASLVAAVERTPGGHRFFAVSALGNSPDGPVVHPRGIAPFRCLDPLRWALAGTGVV
jgi:Double-GTPase 2